MTSGDDSLRRRLLSGRSDANTRFDDLRMFLLRLGFAERMRGSHHIFRKDSVRDRLNLQRDGVMPSLTKSRQVRRVVLRHLL
jgi:hypothetical protein